MRLVRILVVTQLNLKFTDQPMDIRPDTRSDIKADIVADIKGNMEVDMFLLYQPVRMNRFIISTLYMKVLYLMDLFMGLRESPGIVIYSNPIIVVNLLLLLSMIHRQKTTSLQWTIQLTTNLLWTI